MLSTDEMALLHFEGSWFVEGGPKDQLIELRLGLRAATYYDLLLELIEKPESMTRDPLTVLRVRGLIEPADVVEGALG